MSTLTNTATVSLPLAIRRFAVHYLEMCVVMCMGGGLLDAIVFAGLAALGVDLVAVSPELAILVITVNFVVVMGVYMQLRGHAVQHNVEMSGSTLIGGFAFMAMSWLGWIDTSPLASWLRVFSLVCTPLCGLMLVVMLARFGHYGGRVGAPIPVAAAAGDYTCPMHPEVRQASPGRCPACGMTLVRRSA